MSPSSERFAQLLTEGIYTIKRREAKPIHVIQDELGYVLGREGGSAVEYWRKGNVPKKFADIIELAQELTRRGKLGREWLEQFLQSAGHHTLDELIGKLGDEDASGLLATLTGDLPPKPYKELVGRDQLVNDVIDSLKSPDSHWIVGVDGMGGIGKTALAREVLEQCLVERLFDAGVWIQASKKDPVSHQQASSFALTFETVLDAIGTQLDDNETSQLRITEKQARVQAMLDRERVLVVLDNLETADEPQEELIAKLRPLLGPSKALVTSRHRFKGETYAINLTGLGHQASILFIQHTGEEKGIKRIANATTEELTPLVQTTNGSPLAMKLVVGQLGHLPVEVVLDQLQNVQLANHVNENDYSQFYRFIFMPSWQLLSMDGKKLLVSMAHFPPGVGGTFDAVKATSRLDSSTLGYQIDALWQLSFLEVGDSSSLHHIRYYLHALTHYFVLSDIVQELK
ncbi:AAA family ATPase [Chloroflexi bacterium TSY]|nr:AAA family ATPase [Chloroflexi bacterium TSY]